MRRGARYNWQRWGDGEHRNAIHSHSHAIKATQTLLFWLLVLGIMLWLEGYVRDQFVSALQISGQVDRGRRGWTDDQVESLLNDTLLVFGSLVILLAPMALALAIGETRPGGAGWKLLTFVCCALAAWFIIFPSNLLIALVAWALAWACAMARRMISIDAVPDPRGLRRTSPSCPIY